MSPCRHVHVHVTATLTAALPARVAGCRYDGRKWREIDDGRNAGRFVVDAPRASPVLGARGHGAAGGEEGEGYAAWLARREEERSAQQEINLQLGEYSGSSHKQMRVLPPELVAGFDDFPQVFGAQVKPPRATAPTPMSTGSPRHAAVATRRYMDMDMDMDPLRPPTTSNRHV